MTLALAISLNVLLMLALLGALSLVMSRAARLRPHLQTAAAPAFEPVRARTGARARRTTRSSSILAAARS